LIKQKNIFNTKKNDPYKNYQSMDLFSDDIIPLADTMKKIEEDNIKNKEEFEPETISDHIVDERSDKQNSDFLNKTLLRKKKLRAKKKKHFINPKLNGIKSSCNGKKNENKNFNSDSLLSNYDKDLKSYKLDCLSSIKNQIVNLYKCYKSLENLIKNDTDNKFIKTEPKKEKIKGKKNQKNKAEITKLNNVEGIKSSKTEQNKNKDEFDGLAQEFEKISSKIKKLNNLFLFIPKTPEEIKEKNSKREKICSNEEKKDRNDNERVSDFWKPLTKTIKFIEKNSNLIFGFNFREDFIKKYGLGIKRMKEIVNLKMYQLIDLFFRPSEKKEEKKSEKETKTKKEDSEDMEKIKNFLTEEEKIKGYDIFESLKRLQTVEDLLNYKSKMKFREKNQYLLFIFIMNKTYNEIFNYYYEDNKNIQNPSYLNNTIDLRSLISYFRESKSDSRKMSFSEFIEGIKSRSGKNKVDTQGKIFLSEIPLNVGIINVFDDFEKNIKHPKLTLDSTSQNYFSFEFSKNKNSTTKDSNPDYYQKTISKNDPLFYSSLGEDFTKFSFSFGDDKFNQSFIFNEKECFESLNNSLFH
jgi:hypothetical protein